MRTADLLAEMPMFEALSPGQRERVAGIAIEKAFAKGQVIFSDGEEAHGFYVATAGRVKVYKLSPEGKEQILHIFGPGDPFGEVPVFAGQSFPAHAVALETSRLVFLPRDDFVALVAANPALALNLLATLSQRLRQFTKMIDALSLKEVPGRLAAHLLYLSEKQSAGDHLQLELSKTQLASLLGTIPETLSRMLSKVQREGLIAIEGASISIIDREGLVELAEVGKF